MAIEQISSASALERYRVAVSAAHRSPDVTPDASDAAAQESDARRVAESVSGASPAYLQGPESQPLPSGVGTRADIVPVAGDPAGSLERASREIERAYASVSPPLEDRIAAEEAYRAQAAARSELALQAQAGGARSLDITA